MEWSNPHLEQGGILPLHSYIRDIANVFALYPTQITLKGIKCILVVFVLYAELDLPQPLPQLGYQWLGNHNSKAMSKVGRYPWNYFIAWGIRKAGHTHASHRGKFQRYDLYPPVPGTESIGGPSKGPGDTPMVEGSSREERPTLEKEKDTRCCVHAEGHPAPTEVSQPRIMQILPFARVCGCV
uniref:Uncharacterized protein n=1 Tax=Cannabis sativa TaxID=3483 RepID=A0A803QPH9_CANSA